MTTSITVTPLIGTLMGPLMGPLTGVPAGTSFGTFPFGTDGDLVLDGETLQILAGSVADYNSITIINGGTLEIVNDLGSQNGGEIPTIIGCKHDCTLITGGAIRAVQMAQARFVADAGTYTYSKTPLPSGIKKTPISFDTILHLGGAGFGSTTFYGHGVGGEGGGLGGAGDVSVGEGWGMSGAGGEGSQGGPNPGTDAASGGFGVNGHKGEDCVGPGTQNGGGGAGATRGYGGGCFYLQVNGTLTVSGVCLLAYGSNGGNGGDGGIAGASAGDAFGGTGGGGGAGSDGGKIIVRYHLGSCNSSNCDVHGGIAGTGGAAGTASGGIMNSDGGPGNPGEDGIDGSTDIASF